MLPSEIHNGGIQEGKPQKLIFKLTQITKKQERGIEANEPLTHASNLKERN